MQVAILCGGLGTRLMPLTENAPKSLIEIKGKSFLDYQLCRIRQDGIEDVVLCVGHLGEQIEQAFGDGRDHGLNITYSYEEEGNPLGTAGALKKAAPLLKDTFFTMYGDSYLFLDFAAIMSCFQAAGRTGLMVVYQNNNLYDKSNVAIGEDRVVYYNKNDRTGELIYIDYGASLFKKQMLDMVPSGKFHPLEDVFAALIQQGELTAYQTQRRFYHVGTFEGLQEFKDYISETGNKA